MKFVPSSLTARLIPVLAILVVAGAMIAWQWPDTTTPTARAASGSNTTADDANRAARSDTPAFGSRTHNKLAHSAAHVRVTAIRSNGKVRVHLNIDPGWHVNANPASLAFLIPTQLTLHRKGSQVPATVTYPEGHTVDVGLTRPIRVYSHEVRITATLADMTRATPLTARLRVQACSNEGRCLVPSTINVPFLSAARR